MHAMDPASGALSSVDEVAKQLLNTIALRHADNKPLTVTEAMTMGAIASPATLHRKIDDLREAGLIEQVFEGKIAAQNTSSRRQQQTNILQTLAK